MAACGTPLVAARGGRVQYSGYQAAAGNYIVIDGKGTGFDFAYMHLLEPSPLQEGMTVRTGQPIGIVGETGDATACHLHFEIWTAPGWYEGGSPIDPLPYLEGGTPTANENGFSFSDTVSRRDWAETAMRAPRRGRLPQRRRAARGDRAACRRALRADRAGDRPPARLGRRASVYRTLDQLDQLHLVQRVEIGGDAAGYERVDPDAPPSPRLRRVRPARALCRPLAGAGDRGGQPAADFEVSAHDVVLRGRCPDCKTAA